MAECLLCGGAAVETRQDYSSRTIFNCASCGMYVVSDVALKDVGANPYELAAFMQRRQIIGKKDTVLISYDKSRLDKGYLQYTVKQMLETLPFAKMQILSDFAA